jgi:aminocarboxymuconate-semialdehyde decarboxylase
MIEPPRRLQGVDLHTHYWPDAFLQAAATGKSWYGWTVEYRDGKAFLCSDHTRDYPISIPSADLGDNLGRHQRRSSAQGIDLEAVMVVGYLWSYHLGAADSAALARELNTELAEVERRDAEHFVGLAHVPAPHTKAAIDEIEYAVKELGLRHFSLASHVNGLNLDEPAMVPILDAIAESGSTLSIHPAFFDKLGEHDRLTGPFKAGGIAPPLEASIGFLGVMASGVLDRYPDFRVWSSHGGGVAMYTMGRLQMRWDALAVEDRPMAAGPFEYLRRFWVGNLVHDPESLKLLINRIGIDRITIGTDTPFKWDQPGGSANWIRGLEWLDDDQKDRILRLNAIEFLNGPSETSAGDP